MTPAERRQVWVTTAVVAFLFAVGGLVLFLVDMKIGG